MPSTNKRASRFGSSGTLALKWLLYQGTLHSDHRYLAIKSRLVRLASRLGWYEHHIIRQLGRVVPRGGTAVDVGANCGVYTATFLRAVGPTGQVHALEPNPAYQRMLLTCGAHHPGFHYHSLAAGATERLQRLHVPRLRIGALEPALASLVQLSVAGTDLDVRVVPLDELLASIERVDVIKIDVEGLELEVLLGSMQLLRRFRPALIVETLDLEALEQLFRTSGTGYRRTYPDALGLAGTEQALDSTYVFEWHEE